MAGDIPGRPARDRRPGWPRGGPRSCPNPSLQRRHSDAPGGPGFIVVLLQSTFQGARRLKQRALPDCGSSTRPNQEPTCRPAYGGPRVAGRETSLSTAMPAEPSWATRAFDLYNALSKARRGTSPRPSSSFSLCRPPRTASPPTSPTAATGHREVGRPSQALAGPRSGGGRPIKTTLKRPSQPPTYYGTFAGVPTYVAQPRPRGCWAGRLGAPDWADRVRLGGGRFVRRARAVVPGRGTPTSGELNEPGRSTSGSWIMEGGPAARRSGFSISEQDRHAGHEGTRGAAAGGLLQGAACTAATGLDPTSNVQ